MPTQTTSADMFLLWADIAQASGDRKRAQLYIECAYEAMDQAYRAKAPVVRLVHATNSDTMAES
jgi:hypothetical protein